MIVIQSVLNTVYHVLKNASLDSCVLPNPECVKCIEVIASYPIQMLRILAKSVLSILYPHLNYIRKESMLLDDAELISFVNYLYAQPCFNNAVTLPICGYMEDVLILNENRLALLQYNVSKIILAVKEKQKDPAVLSLFDKLLSLLLTPTHLAFSQKGHHQQKLDNIWLESDVPTVDGYDLLTTQSLEPFDPFICMLKHFVIYVQGILSSSVELTSFTINSITAFLGFIRDLMKFRDLQGRIIDYMAENSVCLCILLKLIEQWNSKLLFYECVTL